MSKHKYQIYYRITQDPYVDARKEGRLKKKKLCGNRKLKGLLSERLDMEGDEFKVLSKPTAMHKRLENYQPLWYMEHLCIAWMTNKYDIAIPDVAVLNMMYDMDWVTMKGIAALSLQSYGRIRISFGKLGKRGLIKSIDHRGDKWKYTLTHQSRLYVAQYRRYLYGVEPFPTYA